MVEKGKGWEFIMLGLIFAFFIFTLLGYWLYKSVISPMVMFNAIWLVTLALYEMKWSEIQNDLNERCILCIWLCLLGFNIACIVTKLFPKIKSANGVGLRFKTRRYIPLNKRIVYINIFILIVLLLEGWYSEGFPLFWILFRAEKTYFDFGIPSLNGALYGLIICMGAYSLFKKTKWKYFYLGIGLLVVSRQVIMSIVIEGIIVYLFENPETLKNVDKKKVALVGIAALVFFGIYGNFRTGKSSFNFVFEAKPAYANMPTVFKWIYAYLCFAINNFNQLVAISDGGINYGSSMMNELLPTVLAGKIGFHDVYNPYYLVKINFNVSTYLPSVYLDFGMPGIFIFNMLIGAMGSILFRRHVQHRCVCNQLYYAVYIHNILLLLFANFFLNPTIIVQFIYIWLLFKNTDVKQRQEWRSRSENSYYHCSGI
ncbi:MAG: oligosaccharide repeat unit polymerase [Clostridium sp.]|nr:oligosaccharide repeat unit polymerase [Clostridium sp.]